MKDVQKLGEKMNSRQREKSEEQSRGDDTAIGVSCKGEVYTTPKVLQKMQCLTKNILTTI